MQPKVPLLAHARDMAWTAAVVIRIVLPALTITALGIAHLLGWF